MARVWTLAALLPGSVVLDKLFNLSIFQFLQLKIGGNNYFFILWDQKKMTCVVLRTRPVTQ